MVAKFPTSVQSARYPASRPGAKCRMRARTNLGFNKCVTVKMAPRRMQIPPTTKYAMPKNGFLPPITVLVLRTIDLVPL